MRVRVGISRRDAQYLAGPTRLCAGTAHGVLLIKPRIDDDEISVGIDFNYSRDEVLAHQL